MFILYWIDPVPYSVNRTGTEVELVVHTPQTWWSPIGFFNSVIPTQNFVQGRNPEGCFWHPTSRENLQSRISPRFCYRIANLKPEIREIQDPEKPTDDPQASCRSCWFSNSQSSLVKIYFRLSGFQSSFLLFTSATVRLFTLHHKVWHRTHPICDAPLSKSARRSFAFVTFFAPKSSFFSVM